MSWRRRRSTDRPEGPAPRTPSAADSRHRAPAPRFSGAVLAGGRSRRFGSDKARHPYHGRTLLEHALAALDGADEKLVVSGDARAEAPVRAVGDLRPGFGALSGLHAALAHASHPWVAVIACDMPFLVPRLWPFLLQRAEEALIVLPEGPAGPEPLAALYHRELLPLLEACMERGGSPLRTLPSGVASRIVGWAELGTHFDEQLFLNANRPEDLP